MPSFYDPLQIKITSIADVNPPLQFIASGSLRDTLESLATAKERPLVITSADRTDILLGLAAASMAGGPHAAGLIATNGSKLGTPYAHTASRRSEFLGLNALNPVLVPGTMDPHGVRKNI